MNRPWLNHYGPVPHHLTYPAGSMSDAVTAHVHGKPEQEALSFMGRRITYRALGAHIARTARAFKGLGIRKGDRVTLCKPKIPQTV